MNTGAPIKTLNDLNKKFLFTVRNKIYLYGNHFNVL